MTGYKSGHPKPKSCCNPISPDSSLHITNWKPRQISDRNWNYDIANTSLIEISPGMKPSFQKVFDFRVPLVGTDSPQLALSQNSHFQKDPARTIQSKNPRILSPVNPTSCATTEPENHEGEGQMKLERLLPNRSYENTYSLRPLPSEKEKSKHIP